MTTTKRQLGQNFLILCIASVHFACALFGSGDDLPAKSSATRYSPPPSPFQSTSTGGADNAWQSEKTGNTIAVNSLCDKGKDSTLDALQNSLLGGIEHVTIDKSEATPFDGSEGRRVNASGILENIPVKISLMLFKKNGCNYDLIYIGKKSVYGLELPMFEKFIAGFHIQ